MNYWATLCAAAAGLVLVCQPADSFAKDGPTSPARAFEAQRLFEQALAAMKANRLDEACPKFERSQELDPATGTEFRLAECYEKQGKLVRAGVLYQDVIDASKAANRRDRVLQAQRALDALRPRVPVLVLRVSAGAAALPGLEVLRDDEPIDAASFGQGLPVDPGDHRLVARAPGHESFEHKASLAEGTTLTIDVPDLTPTASAPVQSLPAEAPIPTVPLGFAIGLGALGVVGVTIGAIFGARASSQWSDAESACLETEPRVCSPAGVEAADDASTSATVSTASFVIGALALAGAIAPLVLVVTESEEPASAAVALLPAPQALVATLFGRF